MDGRGLDNLRISPRKRILYCRPAVDQLTRKVDVNFVAHRKHTDGPERFDRGTEHVE